MYGDGTRNLGVVTMDSATASIITALISAASAVTVALINRAERRKAATSESITPSSPSWPLEKANSFLELIKFIAIYGGLIASSLFVAVAVNVFLFDGRLSGLGFGIAGALGALPVIMVVRLFYKQ